MSMKNPLFYSKPPRKLTKLELVDIHVLVMKSRPVLMLPEKKKIEA